MPPVIIGAGIAAAGSLAGAAISSGGAKSAANKQAQAADRQIAEGNANREYQYNLNAPTIATGQKASDLYAGFTGAGGDPAASGAALDTFRGSTGYQDLLKQGLGAVNSNAYASGMGRSGATLKALQDRGTNIANSSAQGWLGNLNTLMNYGGQARGLVAGVGAQTVAGNNAATGNAADASSNASLVSSGNWANALKNLGLTAANAYGSSYGTPSTGGYGGGSSSGGNWAPIQQPTFYGGLNQGWA